MFEIMQMNKENFINEILNVDFKGNVKECAIALDMNVNYFNCVLMTPTQRGGIQLLSKIKGYCKKTGRDPDRYLYKNK